MVLFCAATSLLTAKGCELIRKVYKKGVKIIIASTRNYHFVRDICGYLGVNDPIICTDGVQVYESPSGPQWINETIPLPVAKEFAEIADANGWEMSSSVGSETYLKRRPGQSLGKLKDIVYIRERNSDGINGKPIRIIFWQPDAIKTISDLCNDKYKGQCRADIIYNPTGEIRSLCIFAENADKGTSRSYVLNKLSISKENVMAIGDNTNDIPMFSVAGLSIAMGNSFGEIRDLADDMVPGHDEEGVAWALEKYVV